MSNLGEFSSLLQLGVGFGIGLSFFRAPMTLLLSGIERDLSHETDVLHPNKSSEAGRARADLSDFKMELSDVTASLNKLNLPFMIASLVGAAVNWAALIWASFCAQRPLTSTEEWVLTAISVGWFLVIGLAVGGAALFLLHPLRTRLNEIRGGL